MTNVFTHDLDYRHIEIHPLSSAIGAEIYGVDIANGLSTAVFEGVQRAFSDFGVIFFRDQNLAPEQHIEFARHLGNINVNRFFKPVPSYPLIAEVCKEPEQTSNIGGQWHTDYLYQHGRRPELTCRFRWSQNSIAIWDNRATWHHDLNDYQGERRLMHRITLEGVALESS